MKVAVFSNAYSALQGGGVLYVTAISAALAQLSSVDLFFQGEVSKGQLQQLFPMALTGIQIGIQRRPLQLPAIGAELIEMLRWRDYTQILIQSIQVPRLKREHGCSLICEFPFQVKLSVSDQIRLCTVKRIVANSRYTAHWIDRYWHREATVLYPPIFPVMPLAKEPWILAVGRFTGGGRPKYQIEMIEMFRQLNLPGWELHLAGAVHDKEYLQQAMTKAAGLPVHFHLDVSRQELESLYGRAAIFWHAVGADLDPEREPGRMEHFGIVTGEAMSAGCVPVVINRGGQPEIVGEGQAGVLWNTFAECIEATDALARDEAKRREMAQAAQQQVEQFNFSNFARRVQAIFLGEKN